MLTSLPPEIVQMIFDIRDGDQDDVSCPRVLEMYFARLVSRKTFHAASSALKKALIELIADENDVGQFVHQIVAIRDTSLARTGRAGCFSDGQSVGRLLRWIGVPKESVFIMRLCNFFKDEPWFAGRIINGAGVSKAVLGTMQERGLPKDTALFRIGSILADPKVCTFLDVRRAFASQLPIRNLIRTLDDMIGFLVGYNAGSQVYTRFSQPSHSFGFWSFNFGVFDFPKNALVSGTWIERTYTQQELTVAQRHDLLVNLWFRLPLISPTNIDTQLRALPSPQSRNDYFAEWSKYTYEPGEIEPRIQVLDRRLARVVMNRVDVPLELATKALLVRLLLVSRSRPS
jgi:hypothetical protein